MRIMRAGVLLIVLLALANCGSVPANPAQPLNGTLRLKAFGDPQEQQAYSTLIDAFETAHPQVQVSLDFVPHPTTYRREVERDFTQDTPADVLVIDYRRSVTFAAQGVLEPLDDYIERTPAFQASAFYPQAIEAFRFNDDQYCIPQSVSPLMVYYNRDLFVQAGLPLPHAEWTWDEFLTAAQALTGDSDDDGIIDQYGLGTQPALYNMLPFIWQNGGTIIDSEEIPTRLTFENPQTRQATEWFIALQQQWRVIPTSIQTQLESHESRFVRGRLGMFLSSYRGVASYSQIQGLDWGVAPLPRKQEAASVLYSEGYCMAYLSANKPAAWAFIVFAGSAEGQAIIAQGGRTLPAMPSVAEALFSSSPGQPSKPGRVFLDSMAVTRRMPQVARWVEIEETADPLLRSAFYGTMTLDAAIDQITIFTRPVFAGEDQPVERER